MGKGFWGAVAILIIFAMGSYSFIEMKQQEKEYRRITVEVLPVRYEKGLSELKKMNYEEATQQFYSFKSDDKNKMIFDFINNTYPNGKYLYEYAYAKLYDRKAEYNSVGYRLRAIPDTYSGEFSADIIKMKKVDWAKKEADHLNNKKEMAQSLADNQGINIGANKRSVINEWGNPNKINKTETANGIREQWVYDNGYVYFMNGEVDGIQN